MNVRSQTAVPSTCQVNVLAHNAVSRATQRNRDVCPRGIPSIRKRVVLPGRVGFSKGRIKPTDNVDFVGATIIRRAREIARTRHWSARSPDAGTDVIDLNDIAWVETSVKTAKYINRVGGRVVNRRGIIEGPWNVRQGSPGIGNRIIHVKCVRRADVRVKATHGIGDSAVAGY